MENLTKALLIAAAMMIVVLILSILVMGYNRISDYYKQEHELTAIEQTAEFNKRFENYHRKNIRGNDMISLMNRVIDYNTSQSYQDETSYPRIRVTIEIGAENLQYFQYNTIRYLTPKITNTEGSGSVYDNDKQLIAITNTPTNLIEYAKSNGIEGMTDEKLQKLSAEISNLMVSETDTTSGSIKTRFKRAQVLESILGLKVGYYGETGDYDIRIDRETAITTGWSDGLKIIEKIQDIATQYYEYTQFKRAKFNCTEIEYDATTGRVVEMNFKVQTNDNGVVFE